MNIFDEICCDEAVEVVSGRICDMYGGDITYEDVWMCNTHKRAWNIEYGARTQGLDHITEVDYDNGGNY